VANLPSYLANKQASTRIQDALGVFGSSQPPSISIRGGKFSFVDESGNEEPVETYAAKKDKWGVQGIYLDCVLIDMNLHQSKVFYEKVFDDKEDTWGPPDCWSDNGVGPSRQSSKPQAGICQTCPHNSFGTALQGKGKRCKDYQKFAVLVPGDDTVYQLRVPPNSRKNMRAYMDWFKGKGALDYTDVITTIYFDPDEQFTIRFVAKAFLDDEAFTALEDKMWERRDRMLSEKKTDSVVGRGDIAMGALSAPRVETRQIGGTGATATIMDGAVSNVTITAPRPLNVSAAPATAPAEPPRRGRRRVEPTQATPPAEPPRAPFLPANNGAANPAPHGMAAGAEPDAAMTAAIDSIFGSK
jgi:hypothetical protein